MMADSDSDIPEPVINNTHCSVSVINTEHYHLLCAGDIMQA